MLLDVRNKKKQKRLEQPTFFFSCLNPETGFVSLDVESDTFVAEYQSAPEN